MTEKVKKALLVVDVQNDFCLGGALAVRDADSIVPLLNSLITKRDLWDLILFSRDWHPPVTKHFKEYGGQWPTHCVENTPGAKFHPDLKIPGTAYIISKGMDPEKDAYSPFEGFAYGRPLDEILKAHKINELYIGGLATDYCVKNAVLDACKLNYETYLLIDACKAVNLKHDDGIKAVVEMMDADVEIVTTAEVLTKRR